DASGELVDSDVAGPFVGAVELAERLAASAQVRRCVILQWYRYALGRAEVDADAETLAALDEAFLDAGLDVRSLLVAIASAEVFRRRAAEGAE
ncbi:MAG: DUF1585 domain-containing protein, partial [Myxococcales bacterium]|nr:DUF1585 domain-containing protein [Myxococcales bacterium]